MESADRAFGELLQQLRVPQSGAQILFAFLLTPAFTQRFPPLDTFQRVTYATTLLSRLTTAGMGVPVLAFTGSVLLTEGHRAAQAQSHPAPGPMQREVIRPRATVRPGASPREPSPRLR
ncbi:MULTISPECIES: DUF6328 family protein [Streptomyces]|uniref:DUF6328 family protein n=1 Tax=Streptomyces TaxID=1883 RepID=UPI0009E942F5|nr:MULTISPECIES: DUF6328 family protein [Streptomyces]